MSLSSNLFKAILSMDAYNRGYDRGIELTTDIGVSKIGNAKIIAHSSDLLDSQGNDNIDDDIGFYALAYDYNGETVISFRGSDYPEDGAADKFAEFNVTN